MDIISDKQQTKGVFKERQEKLDILTSDFRKLDESRKDYILELSRKLADIHCGGGFPGEYNGNDLAHNEISGIIRL